MKQFFLFCLLAANSCFAQTNYQPVAICQKDKGCQEALVQLTKEKISQLLAKPGLFAGTSKGAVLVLVDCEASVNDSLSIPQLHQQFGGKGTVTRRRSFNLSQYLSEHTCIQCPNHTRKITFKVSTPEFTGTSYFFANLKSGEAYMPDAAHRLLYGPDAEGVTVDAFFRNYQYVSYVIGPDGNKFIVDMPIGTSLGAPGKADAYNEKYFKENFRKTGKTKKFLTTGLDQVEYAGSSDEGAVQFWLVPATGVCLPVGKFDAWGFFNLGYVSIDGITYMVAGIEADSFKAEVTGVKEENYQFNPLGYKAIKAD